ncbi:MAG: glycosyltransferase [Planctomycetia bacterium]|nr:glycosyltransferase [Planctomycetia bacterium]
MRLLIVSHTEHFRTADGIVGFAPTLREIDHLAALFDEVVHIATLRDAAAPRVAAPYRAENIHLRLLPAAGGRTLFAKLGYLFLLPRYVWTLVVELRRADAVHVRCPAFVSLLALLCLCMSKRPQRRWLKYAGNWAPGAGEPISYRLQRWLLRNGWAGGGVTVNGEWPELPSHVRTFLNPCLTVEELTEGRAAAQHKSLTGTIHVLFVGRLEEEKGALRCIEIAEALRARGQAVQLDLVGDGPSRGACEALIAACGRTREYRLHGLLPRAALNSLYSAAHLMLLPSFSEGWPKVLSEGMAHGVVPIAAAVGSIPGELRRLNCGTAVEGRRVDAYVDALNAYFRDPERWRRESLAAQRSAEQFGYLAHVNKVAEVLQMSHVACAS